MGALVKWRHCRWGASVAALGIDLGVFYVADPFTPDSFLAVGLMSVLLFFVTLEVAFRMRGQRRIRKALTDTQKITYQVGQHLVVLLRGIRAHRVAWRCIWVPSAIACMVTLFLLGWLAWLGNAYLHSSELETIYAGLPDARYFFAGYIPLLLAIPFVLEHVSEWRSHQYVLVVTGSGDRQLHIHAGVFARKQKIVRLESAVAINLDQGLLERLVAVGTVEVTEKAGGRGEQLENAWRPTLLQKQLGGAR